MIKSKTKFLTRRGVQKLIKEITAPEGFTKTIKDVPKQNWMCGHTDVEFTKHEPNDQINIKLVFNHDGGKISSSWDIVASGHTTFSTAKGERTFDRLGVEDSFYVNGDETLESLREKLNEQIEKIKVSRERISKSESIPGIPFMVTSDTKAAIAAKLRNGKNHTFTPAGFGTGYRISNHGGPWAKRCKSETEKFFGVSPLYYETLDCD